MGEDDEIVVTWLEHHANIVPWQQLAAEKGARLRVVPVDDHGQVLLDEYEKQLGRRTRIVAFSQVSNALGTLTPVHQRVEMAHRRGARVLVDGAQAVSHMCVDVQALDHGPPLAGALQHLRAHRCAGVRGAAYPGRERGLAALKNLA